MKSQRKVKVVNKRILFNNKVVPEQQTLQKVGSVHEVSADVIEQPQAMGDDWLPVLINLRS